MWFDPGRSLVSQFAISRENPCDDPLFTGYTRAGGFASHADEAYAFRLPDDSDLVAPAPLLCGGLIGWHDVAIVITLLTIFTFRVLSPIKQQEPPATRLVHRQALT